MNYTLTKEDLEFPEHIGIRGLSFYVEAGHDIEDGSKKVDFLVMSLPPSDPKDFTAKRHALVIAASGDRVIVKTPKHQQSQYNTLALYGKDSAKPITDNHKQLSTRMKQLTTSQPVQNFVHYGLVRKTITLMKSWLPCGSIWMQQN
jgi:hypothetical protein